MKENIKLLTDMDEKEAKEFFLEGKNYCNLDLPNNTLIADRFNDSFKRLIKVYISFFSNIVYLKLELK